MNYYDELDQEKSELELEIERIYHLSKLTTVPVESICGFMLEEVPVNESFEGELIREACRQILNQQLLH